MLIATPNLCLDITTTVPALVPGTVVRAGRTNTAAGGKGVNVARAAAALGATPTIAGFLPSDDGDRLVTLLAREALALRTVPVDGVLRLANIVLEDDGRVTVINGRGAPVDELRWQQFAALVESSAPGCDVLICSGSLPPGAPVDGYGQLVTIGHRVGVPVIVDAGPVVLGAALDAGPDLLSPNLSEAEGLLFGRADEQVDESGEDVAARAVRAAVALHAAGAVRAVVTAGAAGAALATAGGTWWLPAQPVHVVNPIGAGDCFVAGAAVAMCTGNSDVDLVRRGMASASASCETATGGLLDPARAAGLFALIRAERIDPAVAAR